MAAFIQGGLYAGWIKPVVAKSYPLSEAPAALVDVISHSGGSGGKIVLNMEKENTTM